MTVFSTARRLLPVAALLLTSACASVGAHTSSAPSTSQALRLRVQNQNDSDMVIYAVQPGGRFRLGQVSALHTRDFSLRVSMQAPTGALRLYAQPTGAGRGVLVTPVEAGPGDQVRLVLADDSRLSQVLVFPGDAGSAGRMAAQGEVARIR